MDITIDDLYRIVARAQQETVRKCHEEWAAQENEYVRELTQLRREVKGLNRKEVAT